jgi:hypothetical protein
LRKIRPKTTCLYSAASRLPRSLSAVAQSVASYPSAPPELLEDFVLLLVAIPCVIAGEGGVKQFILRSLGTGANPK